jgi:hypothetical protein
MTKKTNGSQDQAKAKAKAEAAQAEQQQSSWRNFKTKELARNPALSVESLHSRFKAMSATQKVGYCLF